NWASNSPALTARVAGTPIPSDNRTQSKMGRPMSITSCAVSLRTLAPGAPQLDFQNLVAAVGEDHYHRIQIFVGHGPQRLRRIHAASVGFERDNLRSGQAQAAPPATGSPWPIDPPVTGRRSCGAAWTRCGSTAAPA